MFAFAELYGEALDGKYRIGGLLGQGGMGAVFVAEHLGTGRTVAVKVILPQLLTSSEALERFRREARAAGRLRHPNIVDVTDFGVARVGRNDIAYLVMEHLDGMTLRAFIDEHGAIEPPVIVPIIEQIALALDAAHSAGMVHRDLKPDNVWLVPDARGGFVVRVLDFGIAKLRDMSPPSMIVPVAQIPPDAPTMQTPVSDGVTAPRAVATPVLDIDGDATVSRSPEVFTPTATSDSQPLTVSGSTLGTPAYMSPEQCRGETVDLRSDIYSLGVLTYEAIAGKRPFAGNFQQLIEGHLHGTPEPLDRVAGISPGLAAAVARAMAKEADDRYPTAPAMAGSLYAAVEGTTVVLRRAAALYADHFPLFFGISLRAFRCVTLPFLLSLVAAFFIPKDPMPGVMGRIWTVLVHLVGPLGSVLCWSLMMTLTNASFAVAIDLLRTRPLRPPSVDEIYAALGTRFGGDARPGGFWFALKLTAFYIKTELGSAAGAGDIAFLIAFLERLPAAEIPERCKKIVKGAGRRYDWIRGSFLPILVVLPFIEGCVAYVIVRVANVPHPDDVAAAVAYMSLPVNAIFANPILSTALVLLYFRSRQAIGEDVRLSSIISTGL